jgi:hypothetical protein
MDQAVRGVRHEPDSRVRRIGDDGPADGIDHQGRARWAIGVAAAGDLRLGFRKLARANERVFAVRPVLRRVLVLDLGGAL